MTYGWREREGAHCYPPTSTTCSISNVDPIAEYDHSIGASVTGGYAYRGASIPDLQGYYVLGDFGSGRIWGMRTTSAQGTLPDELSDTDLNIASFAEGADRELYVIHYGGNARIYQIAAAR